MTLGEFKRKIDAVCELYGEDTSFEMIANRPWLDGEAPISGKDIHVSAHMDRRREGHGGYVEHMLVTLAISP